MIKKKKTIFLIKFNGKINYIHYTKHLNNFDELVKYFIMKYIKYIVFLMLGHSLHQG